MRQVYLAETIRAAEEPLLTALPGVLMQRAATGLASVLLRELREKGRVYGARVLLVVGSGNNGGDALYAGVRLLGRGVRVRAWCTGSSVHESAWRAFVAAGGRAVDAVGALAELPTSDLVVDGVDQISEAIEADADDGEPRPHPGPGAEAHGQRHADDHHQ